MGPKKNLFVRIATNYLPADAKASAFAGGRYGPKSNPILTKNI